MILGITPARGGSKGIPRKNLRPLCGKPLLAWTIEAALGSRLLNRYIVSTEDPEIAAVSQAYGAGVLHRPAHLATDEATTLSVLQHAIQEIPADIVVLLQCTSPVRDEGLIDRCIERFLKTGADSLATGYMCSLFPWGQYSARRQDLRPFFHDDGNVYVVRADLIEKGELWGKRMEQLPVSREQNFEIDDEFDLWLNDEILKKRTGCGDPCGEKN
ncbi:MAG: acylneuraminate cytidylyltransferase family protein [Methanomicrobiales archaeon]|nr:acylneuraminate cytidylyltransferase family protein [Methanomicrobiales archaeon]